MHTSRVRGAALVEAGLIIAVLIGVVFGSASLGRKIKSHVIALNLAHFGSQALYRQCWFKTDSEILGCMSDIRSKLANYGAAISYDVDVILTYVRDPDQVTNSSGPFDSAQVIATTGASSLGSSRVVVSDLEGASEAGQMFSVHGKVWIVEVFVRRTGFYFLGLGSGYAYESAFS